jgi:sulfatase maturation enzyme AslB (radical SAM superfamily)
MEDCIEFNRNWRGSIKDMCIAPWTRLMWSGNNHGPCCFYLKPYEQISENHSLMDVFNSTHFKDVRKRILTGDTVGTPCHKCRSIISSSYISNCMEKSWRCKKNYLSQFDVDQPFLLIVDYFPPLLSFSFSNKCNFNCIMCAQRRYSVEDDHKTKQVVDMVISEMQKQDHNNLLKVTIGGGEPLFEKHTLRFLEFLSMVCPYVSVHIITNGSKIIDNFQILEKFKSLNISISIDGTEKIYEQIRKGGTWEKLIANITFLNKNMKSSWAKSMNCVVMRSNILNLPDIAKFARKYEFESLQFSRISYNIIDENIFAIPNMLEGIPFEKKISETIKVVDKTYPSCSEPLRTILSDLKAGLTKKAISTTRKDELSLETLNDYFSIASKRFGNIALLGTSDLLYYYLMNHQISTDSFTIFESIKHDGHYFGVPISPLSSFKADKFNSVILSCETYNLQEYENLIPYNYPASNIQYLPFWDQRTAGRMQAIALFLNEKPVVGYGAGGAGRILRRSREFSNVNFVALSDSSTQKHGTTTDLLKVIKPVKISDWAHDVIILSPVYEKDIYNYLNKLFYGNINVYPLFYDPL